MANDDRTDRFRPVFEPEDIFDRFVKNANASTEVKTPRDDEPTGMVQSGESKALPSRGGPPSWDHEVTVKAPSPYEGDEGTRPDAPMNLAMARAFEALDYDDDAPTQAKGSPLDKKHIPSPTDDQQTVASHGMTESGQRILLLTRKKAPSVPPPRDPPEPRDAEPWESVVHPKGHDTQLLEAKKLVPNLGYPAKLENTHVNEGGEDGQMPTRELDRILSDMAVLLRYGHANQVRERLEELRRTYPEDLLLMRAIAEFHVEHQQTESALESLFALAGGLFERRNVEGMRQALEQVLVLDPGNARALRLLGLLGQRTDEPARK